MLMMHGICLSGLLEIHLSLRRLVVFVDIQFMVLMHSMLDVAMPLFGVICITLLTMLLIFPLLCMLCAT